MKKIISLILAIVTVASIFTIPSFAIRKSPFKDISSKGWELKYVLEMGERGLMKGTGKTTFEPDKEININTVSTVLYRLAGSPEMTTFVDSDEYEMCKLFTTADFKKEYPSWSYDAVKWATVKGISMAYYKQIIIGGLNYEPAYYTRSFRLSKNIKNAMKQGWTNLYKEDLSHAAPFPSNESFTRGDVIMNLYFFAEYMGLDLSTRGDITSFKDTGEYKPLSYEQSSYKKYNSTAGLLTKNKKGSYESYYSPLPYADNNALELYLLPMESYWSWAVGCGIINGYPDGTLSQNNSVTRAEFAAMISRFIEHYNL